MRRIPCVLLALLALSWPTAAQSSAGTSLESAGGSLLLSITDDSVVVRTCGLVAPTPTHVECIGSDAGGWGACADLATPQGGVAGTCICPSAYATCPAGASPTPATTAGTNQLTSVHQAGGLRVRHAWSQSAADPGFVEATVTIDNAGGSTLEQVLYRRVWDVRWIAGGAISSMTARTMGGFPNVPAVLEFSDDMAKVSALPRDGYTQMAGMASGSQCSANAHLGPGSASQGSYFTDSQALNNCAPGATVQLALGDLAPGDAVSFRMLLGRADDESTALSLMSASGLHPDFWFMAQKGDTPGVGMGAPVTFLWAWDGLRGIVPNHGSGNPGGSGGSGATVSDQDHDGVQDAADNCPGVPNRGQEDSDRDGAGDACSGAPAPGNQTQAGQAPAQPAQAAPPRDTDGDGVADSADNCPEQAGASSSDLDGDGLGDGCDPDRDGDLVADQLLPAGSFADNCPLVPNPDQADADGDGAGDACKPVVAAPARAAAAATGQAAQRDAPAGLLGAILALLAAGAVAARSLPRRRD